MTLKMVMEILTKKTEPVKYDGIQALFDESRHLLFPNLHTFDPNHAPVLENLIMGRYLNREICEVPYHKWQWMLNQRLAEIMPYYNQMYATVGMIPDSEVFDDINYTRDVKDDRTVTMEKGVTETIQNHTDMGNNTTYTPGVTSISTTSNTPQTELENFMNNKYMSSAGKSWTEGGDETATTGNTDATGTTKQSGQNVDTHDGKVHETYKGKRGGLSYVQLLRQYRENILNIDQMIIDELEDLFFLVY